MTPRSEHWPRLMDRLGYNLECIQAVCEEYGHELYIENSFHSVRFYEALFEQVDERGLNRIQLCFDLGHAGVWSNQSLAEWLAFLGRQQCAGRKLHFHLHANSGLNDEHLSFVDVRQMGSQNGDSYLGHLDYFSALDCIRTRFPDSRKVFEVKESVALDNMDLVMSHFAT